MGRLQKVIVQICWTFTTISWNAWQRTYAVDQSLMNLANQYQRRTTILDLRNNDDIEELKCALQKDHPVIVFCKNQKKINQLLTLEKKDHLIIFNQTATSDIIDLLTECEHFGITITEINQTISIDQNIKEIEKSINLGDYLICYSNIDLSKYFTEKFECYSNPTDHGNNAFIFVFRGTRNKLTRRNIFWPTNIADKEHKIVSTPEQKLLIKVQIKTGKQLISKWIPGINLLTFTAFQHIFPDNTTVLNAIESLTKIIISDWGPANMIISGKKIEIIDFYDFHHTDFKEPTDYPKTELDLLTTRIKKRYSLIQEMLTCTNNTFQEKNSFYWNVLNCT